MWLCTIWSFHVHYILPFVCLMLCINLVFPLFAFPSVCNLQFPIFMECERTWHFKTYRVYSKFHEKWIIKWVWYDEEREASDLNSACHLVVSVKLLELYSALIYFGHARSICGGNVGISKMFHKRATSKTNRRQWCRTKFTSSVFLCLYVIFLHLPTSDL